jgi:hypothetical protein
MNNIFKLTDAIKAELEANQLINQVTFGDLFEVDLQKQNIFPLAHVGMTGASISGGVAYVKMSILFLDVVDESKQAETDHFYGNDNENYVINSMFAAATKTVRELQAGSLYASQFQIEDEVEVDFFSERFEDKLAGCGIDFTVAINNTLDIC